MEEKIKKAFEIAGYMTVLSNQKNILKEEFKQNLFFYFNGGNFLLTKDFLSFVNLLLSRNQIENVVLIDQNDIPINVDNLKDFFDNALSAYTEAANEYYNKYNLLIKNRKLENLVDIL